MSLCCYAGIQVYVLFRAGAAVLKIKELLHSGLSHVERHVLRLLAVRIM
jgi:hypothetical protein